MKRVWGGQDAHTKKIITRYIYDVLFGFSFYPNYNDSDFPTIFS